MKLIKILFNTRLYIYFFFYVFSTFFSTLCHSLFCQGYNYEFVGFVNFTFFLPYVFLPFVCLHFVFLRYFYVMSLRQNLNLNMRGLRLQLIRNAVYFIHCIQNQEKKYTRFCRYVPLIKLNMITQPSSMSSIISLNKIKI